MVLNHMTVAIQPSILLIISCKNKNKTKISFNTKTKYDVLELEAVHVKPAFSLYKKGNIKGILSRIYRSLFL